MGRLATFIDAGYLDSLLRQEFGGAAVDFGTLSKQIAQVIGAATSEPLDLLRTLHYNCSPYQSNPPTPDESARYSAFRKFTTALGYLSPPTSNTWYRVTYPGSATVAESSASVRVLVRRKIALVGLSSSVTRSGVAGRTIALIAAASPARAGLSISFKLYRWDAARGRYVYAGGFGRSTDAAGRARLDWTPKAGRWAWRVAVAPDAELANNLSAAYRWSISR